MTVYSFKNRIFKFNPKSIVKNGISVHSLIFLVALFLCMTANYTFFKQVMQVYPISSHFLFLISLFLVLFGLLSFLMALISNRFILKGILIAFLMLSSITGYFTDAYGTVYDTNMLQNALQTDQKESADLFNIIFLLRIVILGILPSFIIIKLKVNYPKSIHRIILNKILLIFASLALVFLPILANSKVYASFFRVHKPLRYYANPIMPIYSVIKLGENEYKKFSAPKELIMHANDAKKIENSNRKPRLMIMIVGETARADRVNFNGYERITFPQLTQLKNNNERFYNYQNVMACGTSTAYSVPCMFSYLGADKYNVDMAVYQENVLDTLNRLGVQLLWRDNNSDDKGVMTRLKEYYQNYRTDELNTICHSEYGECRDGGMLIGLDDYINSHKKDMLILLHQMGNHGPSYYKRYDEKFNQFTPVCQDNELAKCEIQSLYNAYDNALLATDDFLYQGIELLKKYEQDFEVALFYISDHGESLGEKGIYLHGMPNAFAPIEQKHIPAFIWLGNGVPFEGHNENANLSHDAITPTLLKFFDVESEVAKNKVAFLNAK